MPPEVQVPTEPVLVTIPAVEILEVGEDFATSTGDFTFTAEDLAAAVAAQDDPAIRSPVLKIGHTDPRFDGEPAVGRLANLRTTDEGQTLVADLVGVPKWLADIMASAFPSRSIEGQYDVTTQTGRHHSFVIDALALLGVTQPAIGTLADIAGLYGIEGVSARAGDNTVVLAARATVPSVPPVKVEAAVSVEDVRRAYYDGPAATNWALWIREVQLDPAALIVTDDETGKLYRVPYTISGDEVSFGEAEEVRIEYVAASRAPGARGVTVFASRTESRPEVEPMPLTELRQRLGLPDTATDEEVEAAALAALEEPAPEPTPTPVNEPEPAPQPEPQPEPVAASLPPGTRLVDASAWDEIQARAAAGERAMATIRERDRRAFIDEVRASGRLAPANNELREALEEQWDRDPDKARKVAAQLAVVVPTSPLGHDGNLDSPDSAEADFDAMDERLFPEIAQVRAAQNGGQRG